MTTFTWSKGVAGDWDNPANWLGGVVPNGPAADVVIAASPVGAPGYYNVTIAAGVNEVVNSLDLGSSPIGLEVDGTLTFAPGSAGALGREFQSSGLKLVNGTVVNAGMTFTYIQSFGNTQFIGANPVYIGWELQDVQGTATIDTTSIGQYNAAQNTLFDGDFDALGSTQVINLGGKLGGLVVDIQTLTGPKATPTDSYWTQLEFDSVGSQINEWNGTSYVSVESSLKMIENGAYVTVTDGRGYTTANAFTVGKDGVFEAAGGTITTNGFNILAGGMLLGGITASVPNPGAGKVTVNTAVANNGQIVSEGQGLVFEKAITGTGSITFNRTAPLPGFGIGVTAAVAGTVEVGAVGAGQTVTMLGNDTLVIDDLANFAGTIAGLSATDKVVIESGMTVTNATYVAGANGAGTVQLNNGSTVLGSLNVTGLNAGTSFTVTPGALANSFNLSTTTGSTVPTAPDPLFDAVYYLAHNPDVAAAGVDPYQHYMTYGWSEGRDPSAFFDSRYYLTQNPDVFAAGVNPLVHFEEYGWKEGREPSLVFDTQKYDAANPDVAAFGNDPLQHYMAYGQSEGRPAFLTGGTAPADLLVNTAYYDAQLGATLIPTGTEGAQQAAASYDATGWQQGLNPDKLFNTAYYLAQNPDVAAAHIDPLLHYETYGWKEGRDPSAAFSTNKYLAAYSDVKAAGVDPLLHFVAYGESEGRTVFTA